MVSSLTSRLLTDYNRSNASKESISSGYSADKESDSHGLPPVLIDLHKRKLSCETARSKRRKLSERDYDASKVSEDLEKAGLPVPPVMRLRPRVSPSIDISKVTLLSSKSVEASPFLHNICVDYDMMTDFGNAYQELVSQTAPMYAGYRVRSQSSDNEDTTSTCSTSSMSDDASMTSSSSSLLVIHARLDDTFRSDQQRQETTTTTTEPQASSKVVFAAPPPVNQSLSLEDAVGICQIAR